MSDEISKNTVPNTHLVTTFDGGVTKVTASQAEAIAEKPDSMIAIENKDGSITYINPKNVAKIEPIPIF